MASVRSARGVMVDFDLLKIKQTLGESPKPPVVENRESFIDQRLKRRLRKAAQLPAAAEVAAETSPVAEEHPTGE